MNLQNYFKMINFQTKSPQFLSHRGLEIFQFMKLFIPNFNRLIKKMKKKYLIKINQSKTHRYKKLKFNKAFLIQFKQNRI